MGENLFEKWIEEDVEDINKAIMLFGVYGLLGRFEEWLELNGYLK